MAEPRQPVDDAARPPLSSDLHDSDGLFVDTAAMSPHPGGMPTGSEGASANGDDNDPSGKTSHDDGADDQAIRSSSAANPAAPQPGGSAPANSELMRQVNDVLTSQIGIATLLNRLKQSIGSAREFSLFLKKRAALEEDLAQGLKKLCRATQENMRRPEHRAGSFAQAYEEMIYVHERMSDNGSQFASSLQVMYDDLFELAASAERSRKMWKANGLAAEQKVYDLEQAMRKSKAKYDSLADDYERVRTGEGRQTGKVLNAFKNKSAAQHEEDLLRKVQAADQTYHGHVQTLQAEKSHLETTTRPDAIKALQDLIKEVDAGLALQMQKFAAFNEKLLLSNGLSISPIKTPGSESQPASRSLRHAVMSINDEGDLNEYVGSQQTKVPPRTGEVKYERNPVLSPPSYQTQGGPPGSPLGTNPQISGVSAGSRSSIGNFGSLGAAPGSSMGSTGVTSPTLGTLEPSRPFGQPHTRSQSQGNMQQQFMSPPPSSQYGSSRDPGSQGPPQLEALSFQSPPPHQPPGAFQPSHDRSASAHTALPSGARSSPPPNPVFGLELDRLYERDGLAVPLVVYQCIQAVDLFGLGVEGIYRQSGSMSHIQKLKHMFDTESQSPNLDFRNPDNFFHDVNSVTGLLKQFLRELPDPLLTSEHHDSLVAAAKHEDDVVRRDSLHAIINNLPDPNYATLRALSLHLYRVIEDAHINRMNSHNLAVIFGPTLMGTDPSKAITDAGWQIKVVDTILQNTYQIFDED